jgi:hypothetical protein
MRFLIWKNPADDTAFGFLQNIVYAIILFIILNIISFLYFNNKSGEEALGALFLFFLLIPGSVIISGILNGFVLMNKGLIKASKTNFVMAGVAFIVGTTCYLSLFLLS